MSKDYDIIKALLPDAVGESFLQNEWKYLDASTQNQKLFVFDNQTILSDWISLKDAFLQFRLTIAGGSDSSKTISAFKRCLLDCIRSVNVSVAKSDIVNISNVHHYNWFNLLLNKSSLFKESSDADILMFSPDDGKVDTFVEVEGEFPAGLHDGTTLTLDATAYSDKANKGLIKRAAMFATHLDGSDFVIDVKLPLKYLHPIFASDFGVMPLNNVEIKLSFETTFDKVHFTPLYNVGASALGAMTPSDVKLYYRQLIFSPAQSLQIAEYLKTNPVKVIKFLDLEVADFKTPGTTFNHLISSASTLPQRIYFAGYDDVTTGTTNEQKTMTHYGRTSESKTIDRFNIMINNTKYFDSDVEVKENKGVVAYSLLEDACFPESSDSYSPILKYKDWWYYNRIFCTNVSRFKNRSSDPLQTCNIKLTGACSGANTLVPYAIESLWTLVYSINNGKVSVMKKQDDL